MRQFGQEIVDGPTVKSYPQLVLIYCITGLVAALTFYAADVFIKKLGIRKLPFGMLILLESIISVIAILFMISIGFVVYNLADGQELKLSVFLGFIFSKEMLLLTIYNFGVILLIRTARQIDKKFGPGNLWKMLTGRFHKPKEEERIFMFLDLKDSTTIAEQIGHIKYSEMIQDCFLDLAVVEKHQAEIYQYVGDEAVLTWKKKVGLTNANCIKAFFEFRKAILNRSSYYTQSYGLVPQFKAGAHLGKIVVAEVGSIKREIAYHGDTINTAARIQGQCNVYDKELLVSDALLKELNLNNDFKAISLGEILLKGKSENVGIYSVEEH